MPDDDTLEEGGLEPADDAGVAVDDAPVEQVEPEPETYTREQLAELLPHFDQFATHEGAEAFRQYGQSYGNARNFISSGGHREQQDPSVYQGMGLEPPPEPEPEPAPGLWGTPWQVPTTWDEVQSYANTEDPTARRLAWVAVAQDPSAPENVKQAYFSHWAAIDPAGATAYTQQATMTAAEQRLADLEARLEARYAATHEDLVTRNAQDLMEAAKSQVKGFEDHANGVLELWNENTARLPGYSEWFMEAPRADQLKELRRLTVIAAAEAAPVRQAAQEAATLDTDAAKQAARTETSRTGGAPDTAQSAAKRKSLEDMARIGHRVR